MKYIAKLFGYLLNAIYGRVNNYGISIIIFTIILKVIMLPISIKQQKTMKKTAKIQEEAKKIQEKYSNDQLRQSQELMDLYKRENMSPISGCFSSIIQFVIILSMFFLVSRPLTYMKHIDSEIINKYTTQLSEQTDSQVRYPEIAIIKNMSEIDENVKINMNFFGLDLSDVPSQNYSDWKVFVIPALYVFTSIISTKLTTALTKKNKSQEYKVEAGDIKNIEKNEEPNTSISKNNDEQNTGIPENNEEKELVVKKENSKDEDAMEEMNKQMLILMPIMSVSIALIAPLGLALYWLVSNLLMICERLIINKFFKDEEVEKNEEVKN